MKPGNPIYAVPHVPFVLALAMGTLYFIAMLVVVGKAWRASSHRLLLLSPRGESSWLSDTGALGYGLTGLIYIVTAKVIQHHAGAPALTWMGLVLWLHVLIAFLSWGGHRLPHLDMIVMTMTSMNLALYIGTKLFIPFVPYLNYGQSVTMYALELSALLVLTWALIGPRRRARILTVLTEVDHNRIRENAERSRSKGT